MAGTLMLDFVAPHTYQRKFSTVDIDQMLESSHHYVVTRGPRIRISRAAVTAPKTVMFYLRGPSGALSPFALSSPDWSSVEIQVLHSEQYWVVRNGGIVVAHGSAWALACAAFRRRQDLSDHEVLYIGKSIGNPTAPRSSTVRLQAHETLQRIYEDFSGEEAVDVFVTPLLLDHVSLSSTSYVDDDLASLDLEKAMLLMKKTTNEPTRVALAEEALIAHFQPVYNRLLKEWGKTTSVAARTALEAGLRVIVVTTAAWFGLARFGSSQTEPKLAHVAVFVLGRSGSAPSDAEGDGVGSLFPPTNLQGTFEGAAEETPVQLGIFGSALPSVAPWGAPSLDERLIADPS